MESSSKMFWKGNDSRRISTSNYGISRNVRNLLSVLYQILNKICVMLSILCFRLPQPIVLGKLLRYFNGKNTMTENEAYIWAGLFTFLYIFKCPFYHLSIHSMIHLGMKVRVSCCSLIYRKVLRISKSSEADATAGQVRFSPFSFSVWFFQKIELYFRKLRLDFVLRL